MFILFPLVSDCLFDGLLFCFCVIYVFSAAPLAEEKSLTFQINTNYNLLHNLGGFWVVTEFNVSGLSARFPKRTLACIRLF